MSDITIGSRIDVPSVGFDLTVTADETNEAVAREFAALQEELVAIRQRFEEAEPHQQTRESLDAAIRRRLDVEEPLSAAMEELERLGAQLGYVVQVHCERVPEWWPLAVEAARARDMTLQPYSADYADVLTKRARLWNPPRPLVTKSIPAKQ